MSSLALIVDSSVIVKWFSEDKEENLDQADKILKDVQKGNVDLLTPELAKYEVGNALLLGKKLSPKQYSFANAQLFRLPITFVSESEDLSMETYKIAFEFGLTYYDASFASLAKHYDATLVTENIKHQGKVKGIKVLALKDY